MAGQLGCETVGIGDMTSRQAASTFQMISTVALVCGVNLLECDLKDHTPFNSPDASTIESR